MELETIKSDLVCLKRSWIKILELKNKTTKLTLYWIGLVASEKRLRVLEDGSKTLKMKHGETHIEQGKYKKKDKEQRVYMRISWAFYSIQEEKVTEKG